MKSKIFNIVMWVATIPLIILFLIGIVSGILDAPILLGMPFIILGVITLYLKNKLVKEEVK